MVVLKRLTRQIMCGIMGAFDDGGFSDWKEAKENEYEELANEAS